MIPVWFDNRRMGTLEMSVPKHQQALSFREIDHITATNREIVFSLNRQHRIIDNFELCRLGCSAEEYIAATYDLDPDVCEILQDYASAGWRVSWPEVRLDCIDQYEWLFDQHCFVPT